MAAVERLGAVMGGTGTVAVVDGGSEHLRWATQRLAELEQRWSRFVPSSDIERLNGAAGAWVHVHPDTMVLLSALVEAQAFSGFHPEAGRWLPGGPGGAPVGRFEPELDSAEGRVRCAPGTWIDPGSLGKGLAADLVAAGLVESGCTRAMVELGGDLAVVGTGEEPWPVVVEAAADPEWIVLEFGLDHGGVATSTACRAAGPLAGTPHVVDPTTGHIRTSELAAVTAVAPTAWQAEAAATAALVMGLTEAYRRLPEMGIEAVFQLASGAVLVTTALAVPQP